jgi:hypothetical protein
MYLYIKPFYLIFKTGKRGLPADCIKAPPVKYLISEVCLSQHLLVTILDRLNFGIGFPLM